MPPFPNTPAEDPRRRAAAAPPAETPTAAGLRSTSPGPETPLAAAATPATPDPALPSSAAPSSAAPFAGTIAALTAAFGSAGAGSDSSAAAAPMLPGGQFGDYEILDEIARGGMGVVYRARQRGVQRTVALKVTLAGQFADDRERRRFAQEAVAAGQLDHPHIVPIYEVGEHAGQPYLSMAYVAGTSLQRMLQAGPLPPRRAAELLRTVALAVHYAHQQGIIHRDLKPSNVLVDQAGQPRVTDFGLAKQVAGEQNLTATGEVLGTPSYMAPEQALGMTSWVNARSDVYSLGATLYEMLTGRRPFVADSLVEVLRRVVDEEPLPPRCLCPAVPRDLETICLKCLSKEGRLRYVSAEELALDLERYLAGQPIAARPVTRLERTVRWCRRNRLVATLAASTLVLFLVAGLVLGLGGWREQKLQSLASRQSARVRQIEEQVAEQGRELHAERGRASAASQEAAEKGEEAERERQERARTARIAEANRLAAAALKAVDDNPVLATLLAAEAVQVSRTAGEKPTPAAAEALLENLTQISGVPLGRHAGPVTAMALHPAGRWLASGGQDQTVRLWDLHADIPEKNIVLLPQVPTAEIEALAFRADGEWLAVGAGPAVALYNLSQPDNPLAGPVLRLNDVVRQATFSRDGRWLVAWSGRDDIQLWELPAPADGPGPCSRKITFSAVTGMGVSADSRWLAVANRQTVQLYDLRANDPTLAKHPLDCDQSGPLHSLALQFSGDGQHLIAGGGDGVLRCWNVASGESKPVQSLPTGTREIQGVAVSFEGKFAAAACTDRTLRTWQLDAPEPLATIRVYHGLRGTATQMAVNPRFDSMAVTTSQGDVAELSWRTNSAAGLTILHGHESEITCATWDSPNVRIFTASDDGTIRDWDTGTQGPASSVQSARFDGSPLARLAFSPQGSYLAVGTAISYVYVRDCSLRQPPHLTTPATKVSGPPFAFSTHGELLYLDQAARELNVFSTHQKAVSGKLTIPGDREVTAFQFSGAGGVVLVGQQDGQLRLWRRSGTDWPTVPLEWVGHSAAVQQIGISNDERWAVTLGGDRLLRLWSLDTREAVWSVPLDNALVAVKFGTSGDAIWGVTNQGQLLSWSCVAGARATHGALADTGLLSADNTRFSADSRWLVVSAPRRPIVLWDLRDPQEPRAVSLGKVRKDATTALAFSPDGAWLATGDDEYEGRLWDLTEANPSTSERVLRGHTASLTCAAFSADGQWLATGSADGTLRLWQLDIPRLLRVAAYLCGRALTAEERERFDITRPAGEPPPREPEEIVASQTRSGWLRF
ncbi:MAG: serine/threonine-protein kinase, partial [Pirellulales bacterium]